MVAGEHTIGKVAEIDCSVILLYRQVHAFGYQHASRHARAVVRGWVSRYPHLHPLPLVRVRPFSRRRTVPPLKKGGQGGFCMRSFEQIPLDPPFSKGEGRFQPTSW